MLRLAPASVAGAALPRLGFLGRAVLAASSCHLPRFFTACVSSLSTPSESAVNRSASEPIRHQLMIVELNGDFGLVQMANRR